jgi:hypothetical protein
MVPAVLICAPGRLGRETLNESPGTVSVSGQLDVDNAAGLG